MWYTTQGDIIHMQSQWSYIATASLPDLFHFQLEALEMRTLYITLLRLRDTVCSYCSTARVHGRLSMDFELTRLVQSSVYFLNQK